MNEVKYAVGHEVIYIRGGEGTVVWADDVKFLVKFENASYELYDQGEEDLVRMK